MKDLCGIYFSMQAALFPMPKEEKIEKFRKKMNSTPQPEGGSGRQGRLCAEI